MTFTLICQVGVMTIDLTILLFDINLNRIYGEKLT